MNKHFQTSGDNVVHGAFRPSLFSQAWAAVKTWRNRRTAIRELSAMPDVLLRDIGIERYQIKDAVNNFSVKPEIFRTRNENTAQAPATKKAA